MNCRSQAATTRTRCIAGLLFAASVGIASLTSATDTGPEATRLSALLRQLALMERLANEGAVIAPLQGDRYHFDYARLHADIARMRAGIEDYLSPPRAQPRDPILLDGAYRRETPP